MKPINKNLDRLGALIFTILSITFLILFFTHEGFFQWAFARHQNTLSWLIRPWFMVPFCYFTYKRNLTGIMATLFGLFSSMAWFPEPQTIDPNVKGFLEFEKQWLQGGWNLTKVLLSLLVPLSLTLVGMAFWKKSFLWGLVLVNSMAMGKIAWSVFYDKTSGWSVIPFALIGMVVCDLAAYYFYKKIIKNRGQNIKNSEV